MANKKGPAGISQAKDTQMVFVNFGNLAIFLRESSQIKTHGFASPPFDGFAFIVFLSGSISNGSGEPPGLAQAPHWTMNV